jgi:hypothetical protein
MNCTDNDSCGESLSKKRAYEPLRAMRLEEMRSGSGNCYRSGSGDNFCDSSGNSAYTNCLGSGNSVTLQ